MGEWENRRYEIAKFREEIGDGRSRSFARRSEMGDREVSRGDRRWEIAKFRVEMEESIAIERQITEQSEAAIDKLPSTSSGSKKNLAASS